MAWKYDLVPGDQLQDGDVYKIGGRWLRILSHKAWSADGEMWSKGGIGLVETLPYGTDPRLGRDGRLYRLKIIHREDMYHHHSVEAPEWAWVTRRIERERALSER